MEASRLKPKATIGRGLGPVFRNDSLSLIAVSLIRMSRLDSDDAFRPLRSEDPERIAVDACRIAVGAAGVEEGAELDALRAVERQESDVEAASSMRALADRLDEEAWVAQGSGDDGRYELLFRRARAVSALAFALSDEPEEAIYESAHALGSPEELVRKLER